jgi:FtsH-binding integral membrane protein
MGIHDRNYMRQATTDQTVVTPFANRVYGWMAIGLALTAMMAFSIFRSGAYMSLLPFSWICGFITLGIALAMNSMIEKLSFPALAGMFLSYAAVQGVFFGTVLPLYAAAYGGGVIWTAFSSAALLFTLAIGYGVFTKSDLTSLGKILNVALMGLIGITFLYFILSFFFVLPMMHLIICYLGLVMFVGLTAYDAQQIRDYSYHAQSDSALGYKLSLMLALKMYINVIMIFWYLLQILSSKKE